MWLGLSSRGSRSSSPCAEGSSATGTICITLTLSALRRADSGTFRLRHFTGFPLPAAYGSRATFCRTVASPGPPHVDVEYLMDSSSLKVLLNGVVIHSAQRQPLRAAAAPPPYHQQPPPSHAQYAPLAPAPSASSRAAQRPPAIAVGAAGAPSQRSPAPTAAVAASSPYLQRGAPSPSSTARAWHSPALASAAAATGHPPASPQRSPGSYRPSSPSVGGGTPGTGGTSHASGRFSPQPAAAAPQSHQSPYLRPVSARPAYGRPPEGPGGISARSSGGATSYLAAPQSARPASASPAASHFSGGQASSYQPYSPPAAVHAARNLIAAAEQQPRPGSAAAPSRAASPGPSMAAVRSQAPSARSLASARYSSGGGAQQQGIQAGAAAAPPPQAARASDAPSRHQPEPFPEHLRPYLRLAYEMNLVGTATLRRYAISPPPGPLRSQEHTPSRRAVDDLGVTLSSGRSAARCRPNTRRGTDDQRREGRLLLGCSASNFSPVLVSSLLTLPLPPHAAHSPLPAASARSLPWTQLQHLPAPRRPLIRSGRRIQSSAISGAAVGCSRAAEVRKRTPPPRPALRQPPVVHPSLRAAPPHSAAVGMVRRQAATRREARCRTLRWRLRGPASRRWRRREVATLHQPLPRLVAHQQRSLRRRRRCLLRAAPSSRALPRRCLPVNSATAALPVPGAPLVPLPPDFSSRQTPGRRDRRLCRIRSRLQPPPACF